MDATKKTTKKKTTKAEDTWDKATKEGTFKQEEDLSEIERRVKEELEAENKKG